MIRLLLPLTLLAGGSGLCAQEKIPGLKLSGATAYQVTMTTTFAAPAKGEPVTGLRVYHALPTARPWGDAQAKSGAADLKTSPEGGARSYEKPHDAHYVLWAIAATLPPNIKQTFTSEYTLTSYTREFSPDAVKVAWADYAKPAKDPSAVPNAGVAKNIHPDLAKVSDALKAKHLPPAAVLEMCKWVKQNVRYDASVTHTPDDVAGTVRSGCGHCGHQYTLFEQLVTRAGVPIRRVWGLNLYAEDGRAGPLQKVRADFTNVHTWAEVYFPGVGWVEVDPADGEKAFRIDARMVQNNRWFQNYSICLTRGGADIQPTWTARAGGFDSDYGVENIIRYKATALKK